MICTNCHGRGCWFCLMPAVKEDPKPETVQANAHVRYEWDCGSCGETTDEGDLDPAGETRTCDHCGTVNELGESR